MTRLAFPFQRVVAASTSADFDADLVDYAASLACLRPDSDLLVLSRTSRALQSFAAAPHAVLAARRVAVAERVTCRVLVDPDLDGLLSCVGELNADLIVMRQPRARGARQMARRLAAESPCSICLVPETSPTGCHRVVAGIEDAGTASEESDAALLRVAAAICKCAGPAELFAVRQWLGWTMDPSQEALDRLREQEWTNLFRLLQRLDLDGVDCTPRIEEARDFSTAVLRVTDELQADLIVAAAPARAATPFPDRRPEQEDLMLLSPVPLLLLQFPRSKPSLQDKIRRIFGGSEPTFG